MSRPALIFGLTLQPFLPAVHLLVAMVIVFFVSLFPAACVRTIIRNYFRIEVPFAEAVQSAVLLLAVLLAAILLMHKTLGVSAVWIAQHLGMVVLALVLLSGPAVFGTVLRTPDGSPLGLGRGAVVTFLTTIVCTGIVALIVIACRIF